MKYSFVVTGGISLHVDVEADDLKEAMEKAQNAAVQGLCHQCASSSPGEWSTSGELDCDPASNELVSVYVEGPGGHDEELQGQAFFDAQKAWGEG